VNAPGEEDLVGVSMVYGLGQRRPGRCHCSGKKASAHSAQDVTTALQGPHDMHEALITGVAHRPSSPSAVSAIRASRKQNFRADTHPALLWQYCLRLACVVNHSSNNRADFDYLTD
jgi:hypothetical protein